MLVKKDKDMQLLREWAKETEGKQGDSNEWIEYRLSKPVYLALTGQAEALKELIHKGLPVLGLDIDICRLLEKPMYMEKRERVKEQKQESELERCPQMSADPLEADVCFDITNFYTTVEAAVMGGQYEILLMLLEEGAHFDLRCSRLRNIFQQCEDERIIRYALETKEAHCGTLFYGDILRMENLVLLKALYEHGCYPEENVLNFLYENTHLWWDSRWREPKRKFIEGNKKEAVSRFFRQKGYVLQCSEEFNLLDLDTDFDFE